MPGKTKNMRRKRSGKKTRSQRGGDWLNTLSLGSLGTSDVAPVTTSSWSDWFGIKSDPSGKNWWDKLTTPNTPTTPTTYTPAPNVPVTNVPVTNVPAPNVPEVKPLQESSLSNELYTQNKELYNGGKKSKSKSKSKSNKCNRKHKHSKSCYK